MKSNKPRLGLLILVLVVLVAWLYQRKRTSGATPTGSMDNQMPPPAPAGETHSRVTPPSAAASAAELGLPAAKAGAEQPTPDDLTVINGIGPVYAARLNAAGIATFAQLAAADTATLAGIIAAPEWRRPDYSDWIAQAQKRLDS